MMFTPHRRAVLGAAAMTLLSLLQPAMAASYADNATADLKKQQVKALLKAIETGDEAAISVINPKKYIQHNLAAADGLKGFKALLSNLPKGSARVNTVRVFRDGNFVFAHTEYNVFGPKVGFDIFRFENGKIVEHWDNVQDAAGPNPSKRSMIDGETKVSDLEKTSENKKLESWLGLFEQLCADL